MPNLDIYTNFWRYASLIFVSPTTMQQWHNLNNDRLYPKIRTAIIIDLEKWYERRSGSPARDEPYVGLKPVFDFVNSPVYVFERKRMER